MNRKNENEELIQELSQLNIEGAAAREIYPGKWIATLPDYDLGSQHGIGDSAESAIAELAMHRIAERC